MDKSTLEKKINEHLGKMRGILEEPKFRPIAFNAQYNSAHGYIRDLKKLNVDCGRYEVELEMLYKKSKSKRQNE